MKPVTFPQQSVIWAEDQPPYLPLPAFTNDQETISCWALSWSERFRVLFTGRMWLRQMNFGDSLQPQCPTVSCPFVP